VRASDSDAGADAPDDLADETRDDVGAKGEPRDSEETRVERRTADGAASGTLPKTEAPRTGAGDTLSEDVETLDDPARGLLDSAPPPPLPERTQAGGTLSTTSGSTVLASPHDALYLEEVRRTRAFGRISLPFALLVLALLPFLGGDPTARGLLGGGMMAIVAGALLLGWVLRDDAGYSVGRALIFGVTCVLGGFAGIWYFGMFSPAAAIIPFGLYFFSVGQSFRGTVGIWGLCAALEATLGFGVASGALRDPGLVRGDGLPPAARYGIVLLVEATFFATFLIARASRKAMLHAIEQHDRAVRGLVQREELLREAREDLERALVAGGLGRFTDDTLGSFKLGAVIGRGGMGEVYEAVHLGDGKPAAVKLLMGHVLGDANHVRRFMREAKIAATLKVPNVVQVLEVGGLEAKVPYLAMERLHGSDLAEVLRRHRRLGVPSVLAIVRDVGRGLDAAREAGIVHRDLKPRNLFCHEPGGPIWKILDFGVSRLVADQGTLTRDQLVGTPNYMAPEQVASGKVDHRADLYALAVICYRALTGRPAFSGESISELLYKVVHTMPPKPSAAGRLDEDIDLVLAIGMAKDARDRFDSAAELADALDAASKHALPEALRARGQRLLAAHPWAEG
jgi:serine/threonine-protein kinase